MIRVPYGRFTLLSGFIALLIPWLCVFMGKLFKSKATLLRAIFLVFYLGVILFLTICRIPAEEGKQINLQLFWSYKRFAQADIRWQIYLNVFLFIPLGFLIPYSTRLQFVATVLIGCLLSISIEVVQYCLSIGLCEFDDVFNNTIGTLIGYGYYQLISLLEYKKKDIIDRHIDIVRTKLNEYNETMKKLAERIRGK